MKFNGLRKAIISALVIAMLCTNAFCMDYFPYPGPVDNMGAQHFDIEAQVGQGILPTDYANTLTAEKLQQAASTLCNGCDYLVRIIRDARYPDFYSYVSSGVNNVVTYFTQLTYIQSLGTTAGNAVNLYLRTLAIPADISRLMGAHSVFRDTLSNIGIFTLFYDSARNTRGYSGYLGTSPLYVRQIFSFSAAAVRFFTADLIQAYLRARQGVPEQAARYAGWGIGYVVFQAVNTFVAGSQQVIAVADQKQAVNTTTRMLRGSHADYDTVGDWCNQWYLDHFSSNRANCGTNSCRDRWDAAKANCMQTQALTESLFPTSVNSPTLSAVNSSAAMDAISSLNVTAPDIQQYISQLLSDANYGVLPLSAGQLVVTAEFPGGVFNGTVITGFNVRVYLDDKSSSILVYFSANDSNNTSGSFSIPKFMAFAER